MDPSPRVHKFSDFYAYQNSAALNNKSLEEIRDEGVKRTLREKNLPLEPNFQSLITLEGQDKEHSSIIRQKLITYFPHIVSDILSYFYDWLSEERLRLDPSSREYDPNYIKSLGEYSCPALSYVMGNKYVSREEKKNALKSLVAAVYPIDSYETLFSDREKFVYIMRIFNKITYRGAKKDGIINEFLTEEIHAGNKAIQFICSTGLLKSNSYSYPIEDTYAPLAPALLHSFDQYLEREIAYLNLSFEQMAGSGWTDEVDELAEFCFPMLCCFMRNTRLPKELKKEKLGAFLNALFPKEYLEDHALYNDPRLAYTVGLFLYAIGNVESDVEAINEYLVERADQKDPVAIVLCVTSLEESPFEEAYKQVKNILQEFPLKTHSPFPKTMVDRLGHHFDMYVQKAVLDFRSPKEKGPSLKADAKPSHKASDNKWGYSKEEPYQGAKDYPSDAKTYKRSSSKDEELPSYKKLLQWCISWHNAVAAGDNTQLLEYLKEMET